MQKVTTTMKKTKNGLREAKGGAFASQLIDARIAALRDWRGASSIPASKATPGAPSISTRATKIDEEALTALIRAAVALNTSVQTCRSPHPLSEATKGCLRSVLATKPERALDVATPLRARAVPKALPASPPNRSGRQIPVGDRCRLGRAQRDP